VCHKFVGGAQILCPTCLAKERKEILEARLANPDDKGYSRLSEALGMHPATNSKPMKSREDIEREAVEECFRTGNVIIGTSWSMGTDDPKIIQEMYKDTMRPNYAEIARRQRRERILWAWMLIFFAIGVAVTVWAWRFR
jgi:hypothetical protein